MATIGLAKIGESVTKDVEGFDLSGWSEDLAKDREAIAQDWEEIAKQYKWIENWNTPQARLTARVGGYGAMRWANNNGEKAAEKVGGPFVNFYTGLQEYTASAKESIMEKYQEIAGGEQDPSTQQKSEESQEYDHGSE